MGVKHPKPHTAPTHKTNHLPGYHKPVRNPTTNYARDTHKQFCERCFKFHGGICIDTETPRKSFACSA